VNPYYADDLVTLYLGDCREVTEWLAADVLVTDPPYPNRAGHFDDAVPVARQVLSRWQRDALAFWTELEHPPLPAPLVAVHILHWTNVNGRPYEPVYQVAVDGRKRRSLVLRHAAINDGATGSNISASPVFAVGHPTQKPTGVLETLIAACPPGTVADPFAGSGSTLVAARNLGRRAIGVEIEERYCEKAALRLCQDVLISGAVG
jgi:site-specific DNA-methyltransferase (adenine-specific)